MTATTTTEALPTAPPLARAPGEPQAARGVIHDAWVIARGDARKLKREVGGDQLNVVISESGSLDDAARVVADVTGAAPRIDPEARTLTVPVGNGVTTLLDTAGALAEAHIALDDIGLHQPSLDEVFLTLTGVPPDDEPPEEGDR